MTTASELVGIVRGRRLCYELAQRSDNGDEVRRAMSSLAHRVHEQRGDLGQSVSYLFAENAGRSAPQVRATRSLTAVLSDAASAMTLRPSDLLAALSDTVTSAMYWQPPHAEDVVLARTRIRTVLLPIAEVVLGEPSARWWSTPLDRNAQIHTRFEPATVAGPPLGTLSLTGGRWWVTPALAGLDSTTRALAEAGSASLWLTEDEMGWESANLVACTVEPAARVLEIDGPDAWASLVATYPLDVTASRAPNWWGAVDAREGDWLIPDWSAVAADYDGVHVSVQAWLMTSGQAVAVGTRASTTLAGWDPDATWWLTDGPRPADAGHRWVRNDQTWARAS